MEEVKELPEAKDPYEKRVALSIAVIAVIMALFSTYGDHSKTSAIILTNQASDQWAFYQAKSIKKHIVETEDKLMAAINKSNKTSELSTSDAQKKYEDELKEIKEKAEELIAEARHETVITQKCDITELIMQVSVVLCSVAILSRWKKIWHAGLLFSFVGLIFGLISLFF